MRTENFIINNSSFNDASLNFDFVVNMKLQEAKESNSPIMWSIDFIKSDTLHSRGSNTPLKINVPIMPNYPGYTQDEACKAIMCYIKKQIKNKCNEINSHQYNPINAKIHSDTLSFFKKLDICKDIDVTGDLKKISDKYMEVSKDYVDATKNYIETCKLKGRPVEYGDVYFAEKDKRANLSPYTIKNSENDVSSNHFDKVVEDKIKQANNLKKPIMLVVNFVKTESAKPTSVNTPLQIVVPIIPINPSLNEQKQAQIRNNQTNAIMFHIHCEIEKKYNELAADKNPATQKDSMRVIDMLKKLRICDGIDFYNSEQMIANANLELQQSQQPGK